MNLTYLASILSHVPIFVAAILGVMLFAKISQVYRILVYNLVFTSIVQLVGLLISLAKLNNLWLLHLFVPIGLCLQLYFFSSVLEGFISKRVFFYTSIIFVLFSILNSAFFQSVITFNSSALTIQAVLIVIVTISTYIFYTNYKVHDQAEISGILWINSGHLIYYASNVLLFYFGDFFTKLFQKETMITAWSFHAIFSVIMYSFIIVGLWKAPKN